MRRRTKRDFGILMAIILVIGSVVLFNGQLSRSALANEMDTWRRNVEAKRESEGTELMTWELLRKTKGTLRKGGKFHEDLAPFNGQKINIVGFMVPDEQFRNVTEFMLLPLPIECYFCQIPPAHDVMLVNLAEGQTADIFEEPVIINGTFTLHEGEGVKFFYSIENATLGAGEMDGELNRRKLKMEHLAPQHEVNPNDLLPGYTEQDKNTGN